MPNDLAITDHAIARYRERVANVSEAEAVAGIIAAFLHAKDSHRRRIKRRRNTVMIPSPTCVLICSEGKVVSVIKTFRAPPASAER